MFGYYKKVMVGAMGLTGNGDNAARSENERGKWGWGPLWIWGSPSVEKKRPAGFPRITEKWAGLRD